VRSGFLIRVAIASLASGAILLLPIGDIPAAIAAAIVFLGVGFAVGMVPKELRDVLGPEGPMRRGARPATGRSD
jgi:uncharacterized membrane protein YoaK (UPF0700 family)